MFSTNSRVLTAINTQVFLTTTQNPFFLNNSLLGNEWSLYALFREEVSQPRMEQMVMFYNVMPKTGRQAKILNGNEFEKVVSTASGEF